MAGLFLHLHKLLFKSFVVIKTSVKSAFESDYFTECVCDCLQPVTSHTEHIRITAQKTKKPVFSATPTLGPLQGVGMGVI